MQPVVLDGDARRQGQRFGESLVLVGELGRPLLVGQIEVAVDVVAYPHRDPEERRHRRVIHGKP